MKIRKDQGFTLAELLVVVSIVGILVSISIPIFAKKKEAAIKTTNIANIRSARSAAVAGYCNNEMFLYPCKTETDTHFYGRDTYHMGRYYYDVDKGLVVHTNTGSIASTKRNGIYRYILLDVRYDESTGNTIVETMPFVDDHGDVRFEMGQNKQAFVKHNGPRSFSSSEISKIESSFDYNTSEKTVYPVGE